MKILFTGLPYFGKQLVAELNEIDPKNKYIFCDTYYSKKDQLRFLWHLLSAKKVVSFNGVTSESGSLNWVLRFKRDLIMQWHGSDVLTAQDNVRSGKFTRKYLDKSTSFTDAIWLKDELQKLNIEATILPFKHCDVAQTNATFSSPNALTYLAQGKEKFYGVVDYLKLADDFPDIHFHVAGSDGKSLPQKSNVHYYGWISEIEFLQKLNESAIFLRLTEHDGYSLSVLRAIANGNYVLWNNPHPAVHYLEDRNQISIQFRKIVDRVLENHLERNQAGISWAKDNLDRTKILKNYTQTILGK
jgi:hypothetical protein